MEDRDKGNVLDWLKEIVENPENWHQWYSDSEVKLLAEQAIEIITGQSCNEETVPIVTDDGHIYCDACGCEIKEGQEICESCKREIDWKK